MCRASSRGGWGAPGTEMNCADLSSIILDTTRSDWASVAAQLLVENSYARLRLPKEVVRQVRDMYAAARAAFNCSPARRQLRVPESMIDDLDGRNGYVEQPRREWLELHCSIPAEYEEPVTEHEALCVLDSASRVTKTCRAMCQRVLCELAGRETFAALRELCAEEEQEESPPPEALENARGFSESMLRLYRYSGSFWLREGGGHHDMGLLTIIPKGTSPGLQIQLEQSNSWRARWIGVEELMADDEAILFGGMTLARLTNIPALFHRVDVHGRSRISAPYFHRPSPRVLIPATPGHRAELVVNFNARTRAAHDDELRSTGAIVVAPCDERDYERRLDCEIRYVDRRKRNRDHRERPYERPHDHRDRPPPGRCSRFSPRVTDCSAGRDGDGNDNRGFGNGGGYGNGGDYGNGGGYSNSNGNSNGNGCAPGTNELSPHRM